MTSDQLRYKLKVHAATLGEIAGGLEIGNKIVLVSPKNFFDVRDVLLEAEASIQQQQLTVRNQNEILAVLQRDQLVDRRKIHELECDLQGLRHDIQEGRNPL